MLATPAFAQDTKEEILTKAFEDRRDLTLLKRVTEKTFVHEAGASVVHGAGGVEGNSPAPTRPPNRYADQHGPRNRARRPRPGRICLLDPDESGPAKLTDWVRDEAVSGEFGEEYETLKAVYGKDRVTTPRKVRHGSFDVYRISISGGPDRGERYDGSLFAFEVESFGQSWLIKARVSFPKSDGARADRIHDRGAQRVQSAPVAPRDTGLKKAELDLLIPEEKK